MNEPAGSAGSDPVDDPALPLSGSLPVPPAPGLQAAERAATARRNKDAFARLSRTVAGASRSAADSTGTAAREAAARTAQTAGAVREQVTGRVADPTGPAGGARPVGDRVVVAGPGAPGGERAVTIRPAGDAAGLEVAPAGATSPPVQASSVVAPPGDGTATATAASAAPAGSAALDSARGAALQVTARAGDVAGQVGDAAAAGGQQAVVAGRSAVDGAQQVAAAGGQQLADRAGRAAEGAQRAGAAVQQAGAAALDQTWGVLGDVVASARSAVRDRTAAPIDVEGLAGEILALPGVARLAADVAGRGRGLLPGQVPGAQVTDEAVTVRIVARYGARLPDLAERIHDLAAGYAEGRQTVVEIIDLDMTSPDPLSSSRPDPDPSLLQEGSS